MLSKIVLKLHTREATAGRDAQVIGHVDEAIAHCVKIQIGQAHSAASEDRAVLARMAFDCGKQAT